MQKQWNSTTIRRMNKWLKPGPFFSSSSSGLENEARVTQARSNELSQVCCCLYVLFWVCVISINVKTTAGFSYIHATWNLLLCELLTFQHSLEYVSFPCYFAILCEMEYDKQSQNCSVELQCMQAKKSQFFQSKRSSIPLYLHHVRNCPPEVIHMPLYAKISSSIHSDPTIHWSKRVML